MFDVIKQRYSIGDRIRYNYADDLYGTAVIVAIDREGWQYTVELDGGTHECGRHGHGCRGYFKEPVGFFLGNRHIVELLEDAGEREHVEISVEDLETVLIL